MLTANGSPAAADNNLTLDVRELPANQTGYFLTSSDATFLANPAGSAGDLCIASLSIGRYASDVQTSDSGGAVSFPVDLTAIPGPTGSSTAMAGETRFFQYWSRDTAGGNPTSNFSTAVSLTFQ